MPHYLGIDVSTTATKALLIDDDGVVVATAASEYTFETPRPLWSEQQPSLWWDAAIASIRQVLHESGIEPQSVASIGLTGQMHGLVLLDDAGKVLRPAILWNDQRTARECDEIRERVGRDELIAIAGNDALTGFTAPKILWVRNNEAKTFDRVRHLLLPKDYVRFRLTGEFHTDKAGAAGTLLFDLKRRDWSDHIVSRLEIPSEWLPRTHEGTEVTGTISRKAAAATGLAVGTPVVGGGGDQSAQAVGVGAVRSGIVALTLGTSGVVFASSDEPFVDPDGSLHAFCHAVPEKWHLMGVMLSAAGSLRWYRDTIAPEMPFDALVRCAGETPPGAEGLLYLPYLTGERTPHADPNARGAFVGLTVRHNRDHMTRAVLEGVGFGLRDSFELMRKAGLPGIEQVRVSGGGARSALWRSILAGILDTELVTVNTTEGAALGAALLAAVGSGRWESVDAACEATIRVTGRTSPDSEAVRIYQPLYAIYQDLYPALRNTFANLSAGT